MAYIEIKKIINGRSERSGEGQGLRAHSLRQHSILVHDCWMLTVAHRGL